MAVGTTTDLPNSNLLLTTSRAIHNREASIETHAAPQHTVTIYAARRHTLHNTVQNDTPHYNFTYFTPRGLLTAVKDVNS